MADDDESEGISAEDAMDDLFRKFFRIDDEHPDYDKLSLLACNRQGIRADELLYRPPESFKERGCSEEKAALRFNVYEKRRQAKLKLVEDERHSLLVQLFNKSSKLSPEKKNTLIQNTEDHLRQSQHKSPELPPIDEQQGIENGETTSPQEESGTPKNSLSVLKTVMKDKSPTHSVPLANRYATDLEKLRAREMRQVEKELYMEVLREERQMKLKEKEETAMQINESTRKMQQMQSAALRDRTLAKLKQLQNTNEEIENMKRQNLEEREHKRQERDARKAAEMEEYKREKAEALLLKLHTVSERNKLVNQTMQNRCEMLLKDMAHKQQLHYERRKNIQLHRDTLKEINKIRSLQKAISIHECAERKTEEEEIWRHQLLEKHAVAEERVNMTKLELEAMMKERRLLNEAKERRRRELKSLHDLKLQESLNLLLLRHHEKEKHLEQMKEHQAALVDLKIEQKLLRQQNWLDNKQRISRVEEYKQMVKEAKIESDKQRIDDLLYERQRIQDERQRHRKAAQLEKEKLLREIDKLRSSPDPQAFMSKSFEGVNSRSPSPVARPSSPPPETTKSKSQSQARSESASISPITRPSFRHKQHMNASASYTLEMSVASNPSLSMSTSIHAVPGTMKDKIPVPVEPKEPSEADELGGGPTELNTYKLYMMPMTRSQKRSRNMKIAKDLIVKTNTSFQAADQRPASSSSK